MKIEKNYEVVIEFNENGISVFENSNDTFVYFTYEVESGEMFIEINEFRVFDWKNKDNFVSIKKGHVLFELYKELIEYRLNDIREMCWDEWNEDSSIPNESLDMLADYHHRVL